MDIVFASLEAWDAIWRRNQYFVAGLLRSDPSIRVLFVEPAADPAFQVAQRRRPRLGLGLRRGSVEGIGPNRLWLYQPTKVLPRRMAPRGDDRRARGILKRARRVGFERPVLWFNDPNMSVIGEVTDWRLPTVYDVTDDWLAARRPPAETARLKRNEDTLLGRCGAVIVCSRALAASKGTRRSVTLLTNGVDVDRYRRPVGRPSDLPAGPTAVYVGTLHRDRLNVDLCCHTAAAMRGIGTLVMVGPNLLGSADTGVLAQAGVQLLDARPFDAIPAYLQHADVLVVPHVVDAFTDSLDPIKLYEYRSVGRLIVSTPVAGFRDSPSSSISVADGSAFVDKVIAALKQPNQTGLTDDSDDIPTWDGQVRKLRGILQQTVAAGRAQSG